MEFPGITVGGGFSGTSGESSSFRYGLFCRTVQQVEMVLGNGDVVVASDVERPDLFHGAACSFGTLGIVTLVAIRLIPAHSHVSLSYVTVRSIGEAIECVEVAQQREDLDYIDGIFFARDRGVLCLGTLGAGTVSGGEVVHFSRPWDEWFYINAENRSAKEQSWPEVIPIRDYLFRFDRGAFWMGKYTYRYFAVPFNRFSRWLLDRYSHTRLMYHALHRSGLVEEFIIQDVAVPYSKAPIFFDYLDANFKQYPIWICPLRVRDDAPSSTGALLAPTPAGPFCPPNDMSLRFGIWGQGFRCHETATAWNRDFESEIASCGGEKWLYAQTFYSEEQFWSIFDRKQCEELRAKYHATYLPTLYDKVRPPQIDANAHAGADNVQTGLFQGLLRSMWRVWPIRGLYGWIQCIIADEYLLPVKTRSISFEEVKLPPRDSAVEAKDIDASICDDVGRC